MEFKNLKKLIAPTSFADFLKVHWGQSPLHSTGGGQARFDSYVTKEDFDEGIGYSMTRDNVQLLRDGFLAEPCEESKSLSLSGIYREYAAGTPILMTKMQLRHEPVGVLANALAQETGFLVEADLLAFPPGFSADRSVHPHHETLCLCLEGAVDFGLCSTSGERHPYPLRSGDALYWPKAWHGETQKVGNEGAFCLVVHIHAKSKRDLVVQALGLLAEKDVDFRRELPFGMPLSPGSPGQISGHLNKVLLPKLEALDWEAARAKLSLQTKRAMPPLPDGHFAQLNQIQAIHGDTLLERRPGMAGEMHFVGDQVVFEFPGAYQTGPEKMFLAMDFFQTSGRFKVKDIPGWYSEEEKVICARQMVRKGYLRIHQP